MRRLTHPGIKSPQDHLLALVLFSPDLAAFLLRNCDLAHDPLACRLDAILHILYGAAFVLFAVLIAVIWAAVRLYRRNRSARTATAIIEEDE